MAAPLFRRAVVATLALTAALLAVPSAAHADVPGSSTPPLATADDKATIGTFAPKGAPPSTPGVSTKSKITAKAAAGATPCPDPNP